MNDDGGSYSDRPERKKPSYSNDSVYHKSHKSFDGAGQGDSDKQSAGNRALAKGISDLNEKMDKLIALLSGDGQPKTQATPKASAMTVAAIDTAAKKGRGAKKSVPAVKAKVEKKPAKKKAATKKAAPKKASTKKAS
jgi:hypothetical protein